MGGAAGLVGGGLAALVGAEGLKKSKSFLAISGLVTRGLDQLSESGLETLVKEKARNLSSLAAFVLQIAPLLRRLTHERRTFNWLARSLDWLQEFSNEDREIVTSESPAKLWRPVTRVELSVLNRAGVLSMIATRAAELGIPIEGMWTGQAAQSGDPLLVTIDLLLRERSQLDRMVAVLDRDGLHPEIVHLDLAI
jgi:hypothetical protein